MPEPTMAATGAGSPGEDVDRPAAGAVRLRWRRAGAAVLIAAVAVAGAAGEFWAPATYRVNRAATVLLESRLDWGQTQAHLGLTLTPALILWGSQDRVLASWQASKLGGALPHASVHVLPGCGRLLELDCPSQADRYLAGFLAPG